MNLTSAKQPFNIAWKLVCSDTHTHTHALQLIRFKTLTPKKWTSERHLSWMKLENWCTWKAAAKWLPMLFYSSFARYSAGQAAATAQWLQSRLLPLPQTLRCSALIPPVYLSLQSTIQLLHLARQGHYQVQTAWGEAELIDLDSWVDWHMKVKIDTGLEPNGSHSAKALWQVTIHIGKKKSFLRVQTHSPLDSSWPLLKPFETFWDILRHFGTFRDISRHFETFWAILSNFEQNWAILSNFEQNWAILSKIEQNWAIFSGLLGSFRAILRNFLGESCAISSNFEQFFREGLCHFEQFWATFPGRLAPLRAILSNFFGEACAHYLNNFEQCVSGVATTFSHCLLIKDNFFFAMFCKMNVLSWNLTFFVAKWIDKFSFVQC